MKLNLENLLFGVSFVFLGISVLFLGSFFISAQSNNNLSTNTNQLGLWVSQDNPLITEFYFTQKISEGYIYSFDSIGSGFEFTITAVGLDSIVKFTEDSFAKDTFINSIDTNGNFTKTDEEGFLEDVFQNNISELYIEYKIDIYSDSNEFINLSYSKINE